MKHHEFELKMINARIELNNLFWTCNCIDAVFGQINCYTDSRARKAYEKLFRDPAHMGGCSEWLHNQLGFTTWTISSEELKPLRQTMLMLFTEYCISEKLYGEF